MTGQEKTKLISVIIPVFNGERTVERAVRSVLANRTEGIAIETIVNIQERLMPFNEPWKSSLGIMISRIPDTVFSEEIIGEMAQT